MSITEYITPHYVTLVLLLAGLLGTGLQMTGSSTRGVVIAGLVITFLSGCGLWWLLLSWLSSKDMGIVQHWLQPLLVEGGAIIGISCWLYGWSIYESPTAAIPPQISSTNQSGGITGNRNIVFNPVPNAKPKISLEQQTELVFFSREGKQIRETYRVPNDVDRAPAKKWVEKVADYLEKNIGPITADRFLSNEGILFGYLLNTNVSRMNEKTHRHLSNRLLRLDEIMKKLED